MCNFSLLLFYPITSNSISLAAGSTNLSVWQPPCYDGSTPYPFSRVQPSSLLMIKNDNDIFTSPSCVCDATVAAAASRVIPRRNVGIINYKQKEN